MNKTMLCLTDPQINKKINIQDLPPKYGIKTLCCIITKGLSSSYFAHGKQNCNISSWECYFKAKAMEITLCCVP